jgi:photosystem II stability/assembly factor-like uncharacterized protein
MQKRRILACFILLEALGLALQTSTSVNVACGANDVAQPCGQWIGVPRIVVSPVHAEDTTIFATGGVPAGGGFTHTPIKSLDGGKSWVGLSTPWVSGTLQQIAVSPSYIDDKTLYLAYDTFLGRSIDGGETWKSVASPPSEGSWSAAVVDANTIFVATGGGPPSLYPQQGVFFSNDAGQTWDQVYHGGVDDIAVSPAYSEDHTVLISIGAYHWNGGIFKSTDSGRTWRPSREGLNWGSDGSTNSITFSPDFATDKTVFAVSWMALFKSTDGGAHWVRSDPFPDSLPWGMIDYFVMSARYPINHWTLANNHST